MTSTARGLPLRTGRHGTDRRVTRQGVREALLVCGIAAAVLYAAMIWGIRYQGYSPVSQTVSELSAWGVSTRTTWLVLGLLYDALVVGFGIGVWTSARGTRSLRIAGGLLIAHGLVCLAWPLASMHQREVLAAGGATSADDWHLVLAMVTVALMFGVMAFGAVASGSWFRLYSIATIVILVASGALTSADGSRVQEDLPTPWVGLWERINITVFLLWIVVFALLMLRRRDDPGSASRRG
jgi:hypothetical protein